MNPSMHPRQMQAHAMQPGRPYYPQAPAKKSDSVAFLFMLVILSAARSHGNFFLKTLGDISLVGFVVISGFMLLNQLGSTQRFPRFVKHILIAFGAASMVYFAGVLNTDRLNSSYLAAYRGAQILSVAIVLCTFYLLGLAHHSGRLIERISILGTWALIFGSLFTIVAYIGFSSARALGVVNENSVGLWLTTFIFFPFAVSQRKVLKWVAIGLALFAILLTGSRTAAGAFVCGVGIYMFWRPIRSNPFFFWGSWAIVFVAAYVAVFFISGELQIGNSDLTELNLMSRDLTGKNLLSGRDKMWPVAIELIRERPWLGWGAGSNVTKKILSHSSEHNMYLQTLLQVGIVGLIFLILATAAVWAGFRRMPNRQAGRYVAVGAALFISSLMCQHFEITLFQTNLGLSMPMWAMVGLIIGAGHSDRSGSPQPAVQTGPPMPHAGRRPRRHAF